MPAMLKCGLKQWGELGLTAAHFNAVKVAGYLVIWRGANLVFHDQTTLKEYGKAHVKGGIVDPDWAFSAKFEELTGQALKPILAKFAADTALSSPEKKQGNVVLAATNQPEAAAPAPSPYKTAGDLSAKKVSQLKDVNLTTVQEVGVIVPGTTEGSQYRVYLVSDDCNIAYRMTSGKLSIRAEKFDKAAKVALEDWGLTVHEVTANKRPYASIHVSVTDKKLALKTLGSLAASVVTGDCQTLKKDMF